jgi:hypothetical protein
MSIPTSTPEIPDIPGSDKPPATSTPAVPKLPTASTDLSWGAPEGLPIPKATDEELTVFRRALGINSSAGTQCTDGPRLEQGRKNATGIYREVLIAQRKKHWMYVCLTMLVYACHLGQIVLGAVLTALGPSAGNYSTLITILGASNTVIAGALALVKGQGLPERLRKDEIEFRKLQDWIEETEALLAVGVIGKDRREAGLLVEVAFKKYNAAKASAENNKPENYVRQRPEGSEDDTQSDSDPSNAIVRLRIR